MSIIYEPTGRAREYSPKALNIYLGCSHGCRYCYAPHAIQKSKDEFFSSPSPRPGLIGRLKKQLETEDISEQVLISFVGDAYCESADGGEAVRDILRLLLDHHVPVAILTKGGRRCLRDLDLFREFGSGIMVGATLTFADPDLSMEWEPHAALPSERLETLLSLKENGIRTFASFEPVIDPAQSLRVMRESLSMDCIDLYKIGKLNGMPSIERGIDWTAFLRDSLALLRPAGKEVYIKDDLAKAAPGIALAPEERDADLHTVRWEAPSRPQSGTLDGWMASGQS